MAVLKEHDQKTIDAIKQFVEVAFKTQDSLFTPGRGIWMPQVRADMYERFVNHPDTSKDPFIKKFHGQIGDAPDETIQLAAELMYGQTLPTMSITQGKKIELIQEVLHWMRAPAQIPESALQSLENGIVHDMAFAKWRFSHLRYILHVLKAWDQQDAQTQADLLADPWAFKDFAKEVPADEAYAMAEMLLFYVHPESFESISSRRHKHQIVKVFADQLPNETGDRDRDLLALRELFTPQYGEGFSFYQPDIRALWDEKQKGQKPEPEKTSPSGVNKGVKTIAPDVFPLNLILYGPPGTGKTYQAVTRAVEICDGVVREDRRDLMGRYKELVEDGRIDFVTFHQSYGYEEFVEGYRPVSTTEDEDESSSGSMQYEVQDGAFKVIASSAQDLGKSRSRRGVRFDPSEGHRIWKMSLGRANDPRDAYIYEDCIENDMLLLGYGQGLNYAGCGSREQVHERIKTALPDAKLMDYNVLAVNTFKNEMKEGDFVVVTDGNRKFRAIGRVTGPYEHYRSDEYGQKRPVEWLLVPEESISSEKISRKNFSQRTLYELSQKDLKIEALNELLNRAATGEPSNHVLIIDEINRGNISKILGELITLLEPDKRLGQPNELRSKLPYTGTNFGVPANLYVIGTMNTADRSIAFLDTALRRRFEFEEIMPDSGVIRDHVGDEGQLADVNVARLLDTINGRIERLFDRDHTIGHSYLLGCRSLVDLQQAFRKRVIPLLQEYFYGDWDRVCLVLGCPWDGQGAQPTCANNHPIIVGTPMATLPLGSTNGDEYEERLRHEVNQEFLNADEKSLAPFFNGIISVEGGA